jgi:phosphoglycerol transferase
MGHHFANEDEASQGRLLKAFGCYALAIFLSVALVIYLLRLWRADFAIPFIHKSDAVFTSMCIKGVIENGWYLTNPRLGAPDGLDLRDYPMADNLHFLGFKFLSLFTHNWAIILNAYFLLTFPFTTLSALFVFRRFGCAYGPSLLGSLLFSFLPYHFMRGEIHLLLASYYLVPLLIMLILEVYLDLPVFRPGSSPGACLRCLKPAGRILICVLGASAGVYYSFFACFLLLVAGVSCWYRKRSFDPVIKSVALVTLLCIVTALNLFPSLAYQFIHGNNPESARRDPFHAEVFGLKTVQLLLPVTDHRLAVLRKLKANYNEAFRPLVNENDHATLGMIGSVGFLLLIGRFLYRTHPQAPSQLQDGLAMLTLACLFLCTIGGFGSLFSLLITPMIRGYNRISVYIAFFSLFAIGLMIDRRCGRASRFGRTLLSGLIIPVLLIGGIWDQTTGQFVPSYAWVRQEFTSDAIFIRDIEALLPENAMVLQLPYAWFPEQGPICQMTDYDHLRGYLHSSRLRWSYGAYKGRPGDAWLKDVSSKPVEELVRRITETGFSGIYIDRSAFPDAGKELESKLSIILQIQPLVSPNRILAFYPLPVSGLHPYSQIQFDK